MRNLKRALSLVLAVVMVIGLMVVGAGAAGSLDDFSDREEIVNQDAVSLLTILGVIEGKEDGSYFDPTGNVTRAEMAKMIATILNQGADVDGLYTGMNTGLTDVAGHWAESYINYCYSLGIIAGRGDGTFDPGATVTGNEAAKMLLVAVGYDASIEGLTGPDWAIRTAALASTLGIFDNLSVPTNDPLNRDNAALLVYNALDIEMIQSYQNGYAIAYSDSRTLLSTKYGVYRLEGVVVGNEWAQLENTDTDAALAEGRTRVTNIRLVDSNTQNTINGVNDANNPWYNVTTMTFNNVSTPVEYLGQTVTMYVRDTTVLANAEVLGVYLKDGANTVLTTASNQDTIADYLKGTGVSTNADTEYYVNYGVVGGETAAKAALSFNSGDRFSSISSKSNGYGVELTVIDNDQDGVADYVLWLQETLSQVIAKSDAKETTTFSGLNSNKAIDNADIVTDLTMEESDLVLAVEYGGRYYVSAPEVVTGEMQSFSSSRDKQQYIQVNDTRYNPSFIVYKADSADNTYEFDVLDCGTEDGVDFSIEYDFILDSNGNVIAYRPSEQGLYDYALILDSGYDPGRTTDNANGEVKVLLPDGTEGTYELNWSASAQNIGDQLYPTLTSSQRKDNGVEVLKSFLGTSVVDNSGSSPNSTLASGAANPYWNGTRINASGHAAGYVVGYSLNSDNVMTITSIVGTNQTGAGHYTPALATEDPHSIDDAVYEDYNSGAARVKYGPATEDVVVIDRNTVAFYYYENADGEILYGVAVGYNAMSDVDAPTAFVAATVRNTTNLASTILFNCEGVVAEKNYVYVLSTSETGPEYVTLNVVNMDGTAGTMRITRTDWNALFSGKPEAFNSVYSYTMRNDVATLTPGTDDHAVVGYARQLRTGTVALYEKTAAGTVGSYIGAYSYDENIWNVEGLDTETDAPRGAFSQGVYKEAILVLNSADEKVRAAYILSVYEGAVETPDHDFSWIVPGDVEVFYPGDSMTDIIAAMRAGSNIEFRGNLTLASDLYLRNDIIFYVTGNLDTDAKDIAGDGTLWVRGTYADKSGDIDVPTQVGGTVTLGDDTDINEDLSIQTGDLEMNGQDLTIFSNTDVYVGGDVLNTPATAVTLTINGTLEANNDVTLNGTSGITVLSSHSLIVGGNLTVTTLTIGSASNDGRVEVTGTVNASVTMNGGSLTTATVNGTITGAANGTITQTSSSGEADLTGTASGSYAGNVAISGETTVASGDTMTVNGELTTSSDDALTVAGTLVLNGSADLTGVKAAAGGRITFGRDFDVAGDYDNAETALFQDSNGVALTNDQLAGKTFTATNVAGSEEEEKWVFVTASELAEDAEITRVSITTPADVTGDNDYSIRVDANAINVQIADVTESLTIGVTVADKETVTVVDSSIPEGISVEVGENNAITVKNNTDSTPIGEADSTVTFRVTVAQAGKNTVTYTVTINIVEQTVVAGDQDAGEGR